MPTRELVFQSGKAMARPTSRMAKTVSVLATAHKHSGKDGDGDEMAVLGEIGEDLARAFE